MEINSRVQKLKDSFQSSTRNQASNDQERFRPLVVLEFASTANTAAVEWLLAKLQAPRTSGGADLIVQTLYLEHNSVSI